MMRDQRLLRQGDLNAISRAENYPPQLSVDASLDPDKEAWRRLNPFDKHYEGGGTGTVRPITFERSLAPSYQPRYDQQRPGNGEYRVSPDQRNPSDAVDFSADPYSQSRNDGYAGNSYRRNPSDGYTHRRDAQPYNGGDRSGNVCRDPGDRKNFYAHQNDAYSCSAFSMAMMASDWNTGRPPSNAESSQWKQIAGTIGQGYRGSLNQVASNLRQGIPELQTKVYNYGMGKVGQQAMQDLNRELAQGHTAVAKVINPHTGNAHYIYIAGRSSDGGYILGDPDRKNPHQQPISGDRLMRMMSRRDGFVAGWKDSPSMATRSQGSAANRYAMANGRDRDNFATA